MVPSEYRNTTPANEIPNPIRKGPRKFNFWRGIYNKDKNYILGRTPKNWGKHNFYFQITYTI